MRAEADRRSQLAQILHTFRKLTKQANDVGTVGHVRLKTFRKRRFRLGRRPRGWTVGAGVVPIEFSDGIRHLEAQLVLGVDGHLYAALDGRIGDRYQIGQERPPTTTWMLTPHVWRLVEDTIPDTVGRLLGTLDLTWPDD